MLYVPTRRNQPAAPPLPLQQLLELNIDSNLWKNFNIDFSEKGSEVEPKIQLTENITKTIDDCHKYLEKGLNLNNTLQLKTYYDLARRILRESKTILLKHKLMEENIDPSKINIHLERLDEIVAKIFITYEREDFAYCPSFHTSQIKDSNRAIPQLISGKISSISSLSLGNIEICFANLKFNIEKERAEIFFQEAWLQRNTLKRFLEMTPEKDRHNWATRLEDSILAIKEPQEIRMVSEILNTIQILEIIVLARENSALSSKIPIMLACLNYNVLQEVLLGLSQDDLNLQNLNSLIKRITDQDQEIKKWIENEFYTIRQTFVDTLNNSSLSIDMLSKRFRDHMYVHRITKEDLKDIDELLEIIKTQQTIVKTLQSLFKGILKDPETIKVLKEIDEAYTESIARLTQDSNPNAKGRIFDIIDRNAFLAEGYEDEDDAFECFALWSLVTPEALWRCGLLGKLEEKEFFEINSQNSFTELNKIALGNLMEAGISKIEDFKSLKIYNANLLKEYMSQFWESKVVSSK